MKIIHKPEIDYVSTDFKIGVEARSYFENGIIVRLDSRGNVMGLDITNSTQFFSGDDELNMKQACKLLGVSESTMRRRIKEGKIKYTKPKKKDFCFMRRELLKKAA